MQDAASDRESHAKGSSYRRKIVDLPSLQKILNGLRSGAAAAPHRPTIVQCHGCFDIVHPGHLRYLEFAKAQGDVLIVSLTGDAAINKGDLRPYIPQELRAENLAALQFVDYVIVDPHETARELLAAIQPDAYVKGHEYATSADPRFLAEREVVESYGGRVIFSSGQVVFSSSRLIGSFQPGSELDPVRLAAVCQRHDIHRDTLARIVRGIRGRKLIIIGDSVIERYVLCDAHQSTSESPMLSLRQLDQRDHLGGAALLALQAAALGAQPVLVTPMTGGRAGEWALRHLNHAGVNVQPVSTRSPLPVHIRYLVDDHKLLRVERGERRPLDSIGERNCAQMIARLGGDADAAIVYDAGYGLMTPGLYQRLEAGLLDGVAILAGSANEPHGDLRSLRFFDLLCSSERRLRSSLSDADAGLSSLAYAMAGATQARQMIVTLGKRGLVVFDRCSHDRQSPQWSGRLRSEFLPSLADRIVDPFAAGEWILALVVLAQSAGANMMQAAYLGLAAAALRIARLGLYPVSQDALLAWIAQHAETRTPEALPAIHQADHRRQPARQHEPIAM